MHNKLYARNPKAVRYGKETISFLSQKINIKDSDSLPCFKKKKKLENGNPTAHVAYAKHFASCWFHKVQQQSFLLSSFFFFLVYLKFASPVHFHIIYCL